MKRHAYTLVELLAAIVVLGILAGMVVVALNGAQADARRQRAEGQVKTLQSFIRQEMEEFKVRRYRLSTAGTVDLDFSPAQASRARLMLIRDQLRMTLPDRISDISVRPCAAPPVAMGGPSPAGRLYIDGSNPFTGSEMWGRLDGDFLPPDPQNGSYRSVEQDRYRRTVLRLMIAHGYQPEINQNRTGWTWADALAEWTATSAGQPQESAECLYLIVSNMTADGVPVIDMLQGSDTADTNNNGVPEIVDVWGNPVMWLRWPVGYWLTYAIRGEVAAAGGSIDAVYEHMLEQRERLGPDSYDTLLSDWRYTEGQTDEPITTVDDSTKASDDLDPFNCPPLIVSAGPDGVFDIQHAVEVPYGEMVWPPGWISSDAPTGAPSPMAYPDPYLTNYVPNGVYSMVGSFSGDIEEDLSADNIYSGVAE